MEQKDGQLQIIDQVVNKVRAAKSVLVALSVNPTVDEMAGAIGLTLILDEMGKHATAIYSGGTPNALEFLKPGETFEGNVNSLQDFIIALDKEKADHIRYKVDGEYVKVFITPYKAALSEEDLTFSRGEFNVDLVISLNVSATEQLDNVLREHGRILHDADVVNISVGEPGKLGELEWNNAGASSVSEMIAMLALQVKDMKVLTAQAATALLTGIVAATGRFSNDKTTPSTMALASRLMAAGADQQLIAANVTPENQEVQPEIKEKTDEVDTAMRQMADGNEVEVPLDGLGKQDVKTEGIDVKTEEPSVETAVENADVKTEEPSVETAVENAIPEMPKVVEEVSTADAEGESSTESESDNVADVEAKSEVNSLQDVQSEVLAAFNGGAPKVEELPKTPTMPVMEEKTEGVASNDVMMEEPRFESSILASQQEEEKEPEAQQPSEEIRNYGKMVEDALAESNASKSNSGYMGSPFGENPAMVAAPDVMKGPEENGIPDMPYGGALDSAENQKSPLDEESFIMNKPEKKLPMPEDEILPPPPAPPIDFGQMMPEMDQATSENTQPSIDDAKNDVLKAFGGGETQPQQPRNNAGNDAGAFKIPGM